MALHRDNGVSQPVVFFRVKKAIQKVRIAGQKLIGFHKIILTYILVIVIDQRQ